MDVNTLYHRTVEAWADRVNAVRDDQWGDPTPCRQWTVRDLVNHVTYEDLWTVPLMKGSTVEEVGTAFDGDLLGDDPVGRSLAAARDALPATARRLAAGGTVQLSYGEEQAAEYALQLAADHLVHGWDLAAATGGDTRMDPMLVHAVADWFAEREEMYREGGATGPRLGLGGGSQHDLLARFGRDAHWGRNHAVLARFGDAFGAGELAAAMALVTDDIAFETTGPAPDGLRVEGKEAVAAAWREVMGTPGMTFTEEESFVSGDRAVVRWNYGWAGETPGHTRGVDVIRFRDGKICEKYSYVKG